MKLEVNVIVRSAKEAADFYMNLFGAKILSKTDLDQGNNETKMVVANTEFRVLDENPEYGLVGPKEGVPASIGINLFVDDIHAQAKIAEELGCETLSPVTDFGHAMNTVFKDVFEVPPGHFMIVRNGRICCH